MEFIIKLIVLQFLIVSILGIPQNMILNQLSNIIDDAGFTDLQDILNNNIMVKHKDIKLEADYWANEISSTYINLNKSSTVILEKMDALLVEIYNTKSTEEISSDCCDEINYKKMIKEDRFCFSDYKYRNFTGNTYFPKYSINKKISDIFNKHNSLINFKLTKLHAAMHDGMYINYPATERPKDMCNSFNPHTQNWYLNSVYKQKIWVFIIILTTQTKKQIENIKRIMIYNLESLRNDDKLILKAFDNERDYYPPGDIYCASRRLIDNAGIFKKQLKRFILTLPFKIEKTLTCIKFLTDPSDYVELYNTPLDIISTLIGSGVCTDFHLIRYNFNFSRVIYTLIDFPYDKKETFNDFLKNIFQVKVFPSNFRIYYYNTTGIYDSIDYAHYIFKEKETILTRLSETKITHTSPIYTDGNLKLKISISTGVFLANRKSIGSVALEIDVSWLRYAFKQTEMDYFMIVDRSRMLFHKDGLTSPNMIYHPNLPMYAYGNLPLVPLHKLEPDVGLLNPLNRMGYYDLKVTSYDKSTGNHVKSSINDSLARGLENTFITWAEDTASQGETYFTGNTFLNRSKKIFHVKPINNTSYSLCVVLDYSSQNAFELDFHDNYHNMAKYLLFKRIKNKTRNYNDRVAANKNNFIDIYHNFTKFHNTKKCRYFNRISVRHKIIIKPNIRAHMDFNKYIDLEEDQRQSVRNNFILNENIVYDNVYKKEDRKLMDITRIINFMWLDKNLKYNYHYPIRRYLVVPNSHIRMYPGHVMNKQFMPSATESFKLAMNRDFVKDMITVTPPFIDKHGGGPIVTVSRVITLHKPTHGIVNKSHWSKQEAFIPFAVLSVDVGSRFMYSYVIASFKICSDKKYECLLIDNNGYIVSSHNMMNTPRSKWKQPLIKDHITHRYQRIANDLISNDLMVKKLCIDISQHYTYISYQILEDQLYRMKTKPYYSLSKVAHTNLYLVTSTHYSYSHQPCICRFWESNKPPLCLEDASKFCECPCFRKSMENNDCFTDKEVKKNTKSPFCVPTVISFEHIEELIKAEAGVVSTLPNCYVDVCRAIRNERDCYISHSSCVWCENDHAGNPLNTPYCSVGKECYYGMEFHEGPYPGEVDKYHHLYNEILWSYIISCSVIFMLFVTFFAKYNTITLIKDCANYVESDSEDENTTLYRKRLISEKSKFFKTKLNLCNSNIHTPKNSSLGTKAPSPFVSNKDDKQSISPKKRNSTEVQQRRHL